MNMDTMFPHIAGYGAIKAEAAQIVDLLRNTDLYERHGAHCPRGWLFYGDPGMGKTRLIYDIASQLNVSLVEISSSHAIQLGKSVEQDLIDGFASARAAGKAIVLIDELDKLVGYKKYEYEVPENLKLQKILLHELDLVKDCVGVAVIATANKRALLGDALLRSGRFDRQIHFNRPTAQDREQIIRYFLRDAKLADGVDVQELTEMTAGRSCAEIECIVNEAMIASAFRRDEQVTLSDFNAAYNRVHFGDIAKEDCTTREQAKLIAYHEAGHAYISYLMNPKQLHFASIIPQGTSAGSLLIKGDDDAVRTMEAYENEVRIGLAGHLAVRKLAGERTGGNTSDLKKCTKLIREMCDEGFFGYGYCEFYINEEYSGRFADEMLRRKGEKIVERMNFYAGEVERMLEDGKEKVEAIAMALVEKRELSSREILEIIQGKLIFPNAFAASWDVDF